MSGDFSPTLSLIGAYALTALTAYLIGSVSFAIIFSWVFHKDDVRRYGSGNAGATNVFRSMGVYAGALTFVCDFAKGVLAMLCGKGIYNAIAAPATGGLAERSICVGIAGLFVLLGHLYPLYFDFRGGKGVLTLAAIMLMLSPVRFLCELGLFVLIFGLTQIVSAASCSCALGYPIVTFLCCYFIEHAGDSQAYSMRYVWLQTGISALFGAIVLLKHRENIKRLISGTEPKLTIKRSVSKKSAPQHRSHASVVKPAGHGHNPFASTQE